MATHEGELQLPSVPADHQESAQAEYTEDLRKLLRARLILFGTIVLVGAPLLLLGDLLNPDRPVNPSANGYLVYFVLVSLYVLPLLLLLRIRALSLPRLRIVEIVYFASAATVLAWGQYDWYRGSWVAEVAGQ